MATALVIIADGSEEMEAVITIDVLRRGGVSNVLKCITLCSLYYRPPSNQLMLPDHVVLAGDSPSCK